LPISPLAGEMSGRTEGGASRRRSTLGSGSEPQLFHMPHPSMVLPPHPATATGRLELVPSFSGKLALAMETERRRLQSPTSE
ncbi:MAG: hypothetical protein E5V75_32175, partial [Mesorhizobium sp.]